MKEIKIYGDIVPFKSSPNDGTYDLAQLNSDLSSLKMEEGEELIVGIHSFGGSCVTAFGIFNQLRRFAKDYKIKLTTRIDGYCCSAGVTIFLAGDKRIGNSYAEPFVHNARVDSEETTASDALSIAEALSKSDSQIAQLYASRTKISADKALELMNSDTWISPEECMELGFYTELEDVFVADREVFNSLKSERLKFNNKMSKESNSSLLKNIVNMANKLLGKDVQNKIVLTATAEELDFYEIAEDATPVVGDKATFGGNPAGESNDGLYVLASGETYRFEGEELVEIIPVAEEVVAEEEIDNSGDSDLQNQIETLQNELNERDATINSLQNEMEKFKQVLNKLSNIDLESETKKVTRNSKDVPTKVPVRNLFANIK